MATRWTGNDEVGSCLATSLPYLDKSDPDYGEFVLSKPAKSKLKEAIHMKRFSEATKWLQTPRNPRDASRDVMDGSIDEYPEMKPCLDETATIVQDKPWKLE